MIEQPEKRWRNSGFLAGIVFFFTVILLIVWGYNSLLEWAQDKNDAPINQVVVHGEFSFLDPVALEQKIQHKLEGSFFTLDVDKLRSIIEEDSWIYAVSIRKEWPQKIHVYVVEQEVFAVWNNDLLLNNFGEVFYADGKEVPESLPRLFGPAGNEKDVIKGYVQMQHLLDLHGFNVSEVVLSERYAWQLWLDSGIHLNVGRDEKMKRVQRFVDLYPLLQEYNEKAIAKIDLRYDIGLAVLWRDNNNNQIKSAISG
jgi:cell division protein FtsQ